MSSFAAGTYLDSNGNVTADSTQSVDANPRTREQNAVIQQLIAGQSSSLIPAQYRAWILGPSGELTNDLSRLTIPPAREAEIAAIVAAGTDITKPSGGYLLLVNTDGVPVQYMGCQPTVEVITAIEKAQAGAANPTIDQGFLDAIKADAPTAKQVALAAVNQATAAQAANQTQGAQLPDVVASGSTATEKIGAQVLAGPVSQGLTLTDGSYAPASVPRFTADGAIDTTNTVANTLGRTASAPAITAVSVAAPTPDVVATFDNALLAAEKATGLGGAAILAAVALAIAIIFL